MSDDYDKLTPLDWVENDFATIEYDYRIHPEAAERIQRLFKRLYEGSKMNKINKEYLMSFMWMRGLSYDDVYYYAGVVGTTEIPTKEEFEEYCAEEDASMDNYFKAQYGV